MKSSRFSNERINEFRQNLLAKRLQFQTLESTHEKEALGLEGGISSDRTLITDMGAEELSRSVGLTLAVHESEELSLIAEALDRIEAGEFGDCLECGEQIPEKRLQIMPEAPYCVRCEEEFEVDQKNHRHGVREVDFGKPIIAKDQA